MTFAAGVLVGSVGTLALSAVVGLLLARFVAVGSDPAADRLWDEEPTPTPRPADELAARRPQGGAR